MLQIGQVHSCAPEDGCSYAGLYPDSLGQSYLRSIFGSCGRPFQREQGETVHIVTLWKWEGWGLMGEPLLKVGLAAVMPVLTSSWGCGLHLCGCQPRFPSLSPSAMSHATLLAPAQVPRPHSCPCSLTMGSMPLPFTLATCLFLEQNPRTYEMEILESSSRVKIVNETSLTQDLHLPPFLLAEQPTTSVSNAVVFCGPWELTLKSQPWQLLPASPLECPSADVDACDCSELLLFPEAQWARVSPGPGLRCPFIVFLFISCTLLLLKITVKDNLMEEHWQMDSLECTITVENDCTSCFPSWWVSSLPAPHTSQHTALGDSPAPASPLSPLDVGSRASCFLGQQPLISSKTCCPRVIPMLDFNSDLLCCCWALSQHNLEIYIILMNSFMQWVNCLF